MVFTTPPWVPSLPIDPPDSIPIHQFHFDEQYGRTKPHQARDPFTCGLSGKSRSVGELKARIEHLAQGLSKDLGWAPNEGSEWDKVISIFSLNHIDYMTATWAVHRLNGICAPAAATSSAAELERQLKESKAKAIFTCEPLLPLAIQASAAAGISESNVYVLESPSKTSRSVDDLVAEGLSLPPLDALRWEPGQGARQVAYLCYSSGTSGTPKGVMITHRNIIVNVLQCCTYDSLNRAAYKLEAGQEVYTENYLGVLPMSHSYTIIISHASVYRGDGMIVLPNLDLKTFCMSISRFQIRTLWLVPALLGLLIRNYDIISNFDFSSVVDVVSGAAPLRKETAQVLQKLFPTWNILQGYGLTEASTVISFTPKKDILFGSVGSLLPGYEAKLTATDGAEVTEHNKPGELFVRSPSITLGYYNNAEANAETFVDGWLRTGDEAMVCLSAAGQEHIIITDRIKELIKVRGQQVSPSELEAFLLTHPSVADCCVVPVPDALSGEAPKAFVVKKPGNDSVSDQELSSKIQTYVEENQPDYKRLKGGVEFIEEIPRGPGGKMLRRVLRDRG